MKSIFKTESFMLIIYFNVQQIIFGLEVAYGLQEILYSMVNIK